MRLAALLLLAACADPPVRAPVVATVPEAPKTCDPAALVREETTIESEPGIQVFVMRIGAFGERQGAALFTHGGGSQGSALWDLKTKDYSFMRKLACSGWDTYSLDVRGFGGSTMTEGARLEHVMPDVGAAVRFALERSKVASLDLIAWSWGSDVAGMYAGLHPAQVRKLIMFAPVYDRRWPARHKTEDGWYTVKRESFLQYHDPQKEDRAVLEEFVAGMFRFAEADELRLPNGPYLDLYGEEAPLWDPSKVKAPALIVRGDLDRASLDAHAQKLFADLTNAPAKRYVVLGGADHFAFRTYKYRELQAVVLGFLLE